MRKNLDSLTIGLALFSLFFGAGNLIFPPYLGMAAGDKWFLGFIIYFIFDIGLALLAIFAVSKNGNSLDNVLNKIGKIPGIIIGIILVICIGPAIIIPRTAATTFSMLTSADVLSEDTMLLATIVYFAIVCLLTIRPAKVIDIIGNFLTPVLFTGLTVLVVYGIYHPIGNISSVQMIDSVVKEGITTGYQTMDVLGGLIFSGIIISSVLAKGYTDKKSQTEITLKSSLIASALLLFIYGGLTYLGATASNLYGVSIDRTELLIAITNGLLGNTGAIILSIVVSVACLTTAIGLTSCTATYFNKITDGKLSYKSLVLIILGVSLVLANLGLNTIISFASPILNLVYPVVLTMIVLSLFSKHQNKFVNFGAVLTVLVMSIAVSMNRFGLGFDFVNSLPYVNIELYWIIPAAIGGTLGGIFGEIWKIRKKRTFSNNTQRKRVKAN